MNNTLLYAIKYEFAALLCSTVVPLAIMIVDIGNNEPCGIPSNIMRRMNSVNVERKGNMVSANPVIIIEKEIIGSGQNPKR